jgi:ABC-type transport system substrate-binding protein
MNAMNPFKPWCAVLLLAACSLASTALAQPKKILNVAFRSAETSFDPSNISDLFSRSVTPHIFEALYTYDPLARPAKIKPLLAQAMPEASADFKTWTVKIKPGIYFQQDAAFKGQKREVVAQDFVYAIQRIADPANKSQLWTWVETFGLLGLTEARKKAVDAKAPLNYDAVIEGLRTLDRYTLQYTLKEPRPRFIESLAGSDLLGAQAREVVEHYGDKIGANPVGTGPFRLKQWRRSSLIVLERSPDYRDVFYDAEPSADDAEGQAILAKLKGRKLPMVDEVHISIIEENQPRWLAFLNGQIDTLATLVNPVPSEYISQATPNGKLAPNLAKRGITASRQVNSEAAFFYFNMEDPGVGGMKPPKVALRRAISLGQNIDQLIRIVYRGQAIPAQSPINPNTTGYDPAFKSEMSQYDPARAKALLDLYGYVDKDGDGWRDQPNGQPLVVVRATEPEQQAREIETLWRKDMTALRIQTKPQVGKWAENLKQARAGKLQVWSLASSSASPDGMVAFQRLHGPQSGSGNLTRFKHPRFDELYDQMNLMPDGPERLAKFHEAKLIAAAYMPKRYTLHRISTDLVHPWVVGFRRPQFWQEWYHLVDIDVSKKPAP